MNDKELREALDEARAAADEAGRSILEGWRKSFQVRHKGPIDLVTEYDLKAESLIRARLVARFPEHTIVGEEEGGRASEGLTWFVDPLDGTTNFAHGHPFFAVSIGLCRGAEPLLGVVAAPALGVTWSGARGLGVLRNGEPCRTSTCSGLQQALVATGFAYDLNTTPDDNLRESTAFLKRTRGFRRCGSAAIDLAMVAEGTYDLYWEQRLNPWDLAAGALLVAEAGGRVTDYEGNPCDVRRGFIVASNGPLHDEAMATLRAARQGL